MKDQKDPGMTLTLRNRCAYSCMYFGLTGCKPDLKGAMWMRRKIASEWDASEKAESIAATLRTTKVEFAQADLNGEGWGGLPEIMASAATSKNMRIISETGEVVHEVSYHTRPGIEVWRYDGRHYTVRSRIPTMVRWVHPTGTGYDAYGMAMRGGSAKESSKRTRTGRHGWDEDHQSNAPIEQQQPRADRPPLQRRRKVDTRPPLPRRGKQAQREEEERPESAVQDSTPPATGGSTEH